MAAWTTLATATVYTTQLTTINDRDVDVAKALDPAYVTVTSPLTNMVRYNSANKRRETYNGSSWVELIVAATDAFNETVTGVRGGNFYGSITNNGTITGGTVNATTLQAGGSNAWTVASLTNNNQLTNGSAYITAAALSTYAPLASPALTGTPTAPTAAVNDNTTKIATTAWVIGQSYMSATSVAAGYAPLGGAGTSGTWPISVSGNSATTSQTAFTTLSVSGAASVAGGLASGTQLNAQGNQSVSGIATGSGNLGGVMVQGPGGSTPAFMSFHRAGAWAAYFGVDVDNQFKIGGWSLGANAYPILHSGNYTSYSPTLTGSGASGTWGINITGSAASATTATNLSGGSVSGTTGTFSGLVKGNGGGSGLGSITVSSSAPGAGVGTDGDIWFQV